MLHPKYSKVLLFLIVTGASNSVYCWAWLTRLQTFHQNGHHRRPISRAVFDHKKAQHHLSLSRTRVDSALFVRCGATWTMLSSSSSSAAAASSDEMTIPTSRLRKWASSNFFLLGMFVAVGVARLFPALGKNGGILRPELILGRFGVTTVFFLSGLSLEISQLAQAMTAFRLNALVQTCIFGAWPFLLGLPLRQALLKGAFLPKELLDGLLILCCLPTTVNMNVILTTTANGNIATALCNAVVSNLIGVVCTPALLFKFFGASISLPFGRMLLKLSYKVLLPVAVGQLLRATKVKDYYARRKQFFKRLQEVILLGILWNAFCTAISSNMGLDFQNGMKLLALLPCLHGLSFGIFFLLFRACRFSRQETVAATFCASQKTLAFGLPLVNTIFEGSPNLAAYCAPIMFIHPLQLIIGSALVPRLQAYNSEGAVDKKL